MSHSTVNESTVERAALGWFASLGYDTRRGAEISPGAEGPQRKTYEQVVLEGRLNAALRKINDRLPEEAIEQAMRIVARPPEPTLEENNRWFHGLLTEGIEVEHRTADGETRGDKAWVVDFSRPTLNDLLVLRPDE